MKFDRFETLKRPFFEVLFMDWIAPIIIVGCLVVTAVSVVLIVWGCA